MERRCAQCSGAIEEFKQKERSERMLIARRLVRILVSFVTLSET
jgi:hypothetical protein